MNLRYLFSNQVDRLINAWLEDVQEICTTLVSVFITQGKILGVLYLLGYCDFTVTYSSLLVIPDTIPMG